VNKGHLFLVGLRGTGKSTVGRLLAEKRDMPFVDTDERLEQLAGCSIAEIFAAEGEPGFRKRESDLLTSLITLPASVIASGGGIVISAENRELLKSNGYCVWLTASPEIIFQRLESDPITAARRPSLTTYGGLDEIRQLQEVREPLYREIANLQIATDDKSPAEVVFAILSAWTG